MMTPLVSVVMSAYNCQEVLPYAIQSVLMQSNPDLELILVDDASTDGTIAIIEAYAQLDSRIRVVRNDRNSRLGPIEWESRNDGLKVASGRFVAYLDADNTWCPQFVERLSRCLLSDDHLQIVYCNSRNHYSETEATQVVATDPRQLIDCGPTWTIFSHDALDRIRLGVDQYVDTNEMMHRASVFEQLGALWRTRHPRLTEINNYIGAPRPTRRRNDLDLFERIIDVFGVDSALHLREPLVDYFYPSATRPSWQPTKPSYSTAIHPQSFAGLSQLNVNHFYSDYLMPRGGSEALDFSIGEIRVPGVDLTELSIELIGSCTMADGLFRYNGSATISPVYQAIAEYYGSWLGQARFSTQNLVPFDGCHEAIGCAVDVFVGTYGNPAGRDAFAYPIPSYPYWTIGAAGRHRAIPIEAFDVNEYINALEKLQDRDVSAIVVQWPSNPLGYCYGAEHIAALNQLARSRGWGIVADITYDAFVEGSARVGMLDLAPERTVLCASVSKAWGLPGLRLGFGLSANPDLAAALRAYKSGRSLLPSSLKMVFFHHVLNERLDTPARIVEAVHERRHRLRRCLTEMRLIDVGIEIAAEFVPGLYEVLYLDRFCEVTGITPQDLASSLLTEQAMRVTPDSALYPPGYSNIPRRRFIRMGLGSTDNVEVGVSLLLQHVAYRRITLDHA